MEEIRIANNRSLQPKGHRGQRGRFRKARGRGVGEGPEPIGGTGVKMPIMLFIDIQGEKRKQLKPVVKKLDLRGNTVSRAIME